MGMLRRERVITAAPLLCMAALLASACGGKKFQIAESLPMDDGAELTPGGSGSGTDEQPLSGDPLPSSEAEPSDGKTSTASISSTGVPSTKADDESEPEVEPAPDSSEDQPVVVPTEKGDAGITDPEDDENTNDASSVAPADVDAGGDEPAEPEPEPEPEPDLDPFSFFVTSFASMQALSGSDLGFGGDLRYGEQSGLAGADKICSEIAEISMPGSSVKRWRAFLSASSGPDGSPVNAIDRIGDGPWYDRLGRLVAEDVEGLLDDRPEGDSAIAEDLPNEFGDSNHIVAGEEMSHQDVLTGSDQNGKLSGRTCSDWTSTSVSERPMGGHPWPVYSGDHWMGAHTVPGCAASVGNGDGGYYGRGGGSGGGWSWIGSPLEPVSGVGDGGGYGAIYCFALSE